MAISKNMNTPPLIHIYLHVYFQNYVKNFIALSNDALPRPTTGFV